MEIEIDYLRRSRELAAISSESAYTLASLQGGFIDLLGVPVRHSKALVLSPSHEPGATVGDGWLPAHDADARG
ncbi:hypothetical protein DFR68_103120 [Nocardia mexicana]|uniref:Uncharacterized protein n=1 Tax=Nocardia mexicana TaxID=279262 RepID=A0A370H7T3_9NOCA|nr:hypothetical protein DFR68_103120 [Nocardia mexicana]